MPHPCQCRAASPWPRRRGQKLAGGHASTHKRLISREFLPEINNSKVITRSRDSVALSHQNRS